MAHGNPRQTPRSPGGNILPLRLETRDLPEEGGGETTVLLASKAMRAAHHLASQVAPSDAPVLIMGESGTGKELFARLIHTLSNRSEKPFVPVNCGVLGGELFADKFFGHEAGAFTGAMRLQKGSFELAGDGTLFLDEVGEIPPLNQADFLRVLEQRTFRRLGGDRDLPFGARIVAATNRNLPDMVRRGEFRADLYYRLCVVPVSLPPLRQRREDVPHLAGHFLELFRHRYHSRELTLGQKVLSTLADYAWPGNVRELKNLIERLVLVHPGGEIRPEDLPPEMHAFAPTPYRSDLDSPFSRSAEYPAESGSRSAPRSAGPPLEAEPYAAREDLPAGTAAPDALGPRVPPALRNFGLGSAGSQRREMPRLREQTPATSSGREAPRAAGLDFSDQTAPLGGAVASLSSLAGSDAAPQDLDPSDSAGQFSLEAAVRRAEAAAILRAFRHAGGSRALTADLLGIRPRTLRHKVRELGIVLVL
ncbi:hypothetical protein JCM15519_18320 [Fundidesulfovibrio butyratiphilus]